MATQAQRAGSSVMVVDDEESQRSGLAAMVSSWGYRVDTAADGQEALDKLSEGMPDVIITDLMMPRVDGMELLRRLPQPAPPVIMLTAFGNIETAVETVHDLGAFWFLEKPVQAGALKILLARAASQNRLRREAELMQRELQYKGALGDLVGSCPAMQEVFSLLRQVAPSKAAVFVNGESGTGKELVARAIHQLSPRAGGPFVAINCAALPEALMESELFGHEKGAFTGALERRSGCFELAHKGTLLLDELAEMPIGTQAKLLRVLEDSRVRRLGGKSEVEVDVRIVAATNRNLEASIKEGRLREDLYYRLNVFQIKLPALRERGGDMAVLCETLIEVLNRKHSTRVTDVSRDVFADFEKYNWPGNVRELRNVLERAVILSGEGVIQRTHLPPSFGGNSAQAVRPQASGGDGVFLPIGSTVDEAERALIEATLRHTKNNKTRAAEILGVSLKTLFNKLKEYGASEAEASA
ncbi:MAG TPA: sigma-54 dependent transcriptional regulator [Bryobacteraceae bacterium]|nr:sigma-54 dependent transcriptional regulator [Bryobacteraceae bacterium]